MAALVTSLGNAGFLIEAGGRRVFIDAFHGLGVPAGRAAGRLPGGETGRADLILVTHAHWDHFKARPTIEAAARGGAAVGGPPTVIRELRRRAAGAELIEIEPPSGGRQSARVRGIEVTAFRTFHSRDHNSYRVELPGFRFFHDGDNEDTRRVEPAAPGELDALMIGPWQGSGFVEFIERLAPRRWFLMHLSPAELDEHDRGAFLSGTCGCDRIPPGLVALRPGETFRFEEREARGPSPDCPDRPAAPRRGGSR